MPESVSKLQDFAIKLLKCRKNFRNH